MRKYSVFVPGLRKLDVVKDSMIMMMWIQNCQGLLSQFMVPRQHLSSAEGPKRKLLHTLRQ
jgi:hypothetical protein